VKTQRRKEGFKTKSAAPSKLKAAQSVFLKFAEAPFRMATWACTRSSRQFVSRWSTGGQRSPVSTRIVFTTLAFRRTRCR